MKPPVYPLPPYCECFHIYFFGRFVCGQKKWMRWTCAYCGTVNYENKTGKCYGCSKDKKELLT